nr:uncharacterized protein LOC123774586 [Procambarus clarkii]
MSSMRAKMSPFPAVRPTIERCNLVRNSVVLTFSEAYKYLSLLNGRSIYDYCSQENVPGYMKHVFSVEENNLVMANPPENLNIKLLYKLLKYVSGLAPREDPNWKTDTDTLESLINFAKTEIDTLNEAAALTDQALNDKLDYLNKCLIRILDKVGEKKQVDVENIKRKILKNHSLKTMNPYAIVSHSSDIPYMYKILTQHIIHRVFVMVFIQLNCLKGKSLYEYLKEDQKIRRPMVCFTHREKHLLKNSSIPPEKMTIHLLHKLIPRVCGLLNSREWAMSQNTLEHCLYNIKEEHDNLSVLDVQEFSNNSHKLYINVDRVISMIAEKTQKIKRDILREMPDEPICMDDSFQSLVDKQTQFSHLSSPVNEYPTTSPLVSKPSIFPNTIEDHGVCLKLNETGPSLHTVQQLSTSPTAKRTSSYMTQEDESSSITFQKTGSLSEVHELGTSSLIPEESAIFTLASKEAGTSTLTSKDPGTSTLTPEDPGTFTLIPEVPATSPILPEGPGTSPLTPGDSGTSPLTPKDPCTSTLAPKEPGTSVHKPKEPGTSNLTPEKPGTSTFTPKELNMSTQSPKELGTSTFSPKEPGTSTLTPKEPGTSTPTPKKPGTSTLTPKDPSVSLFSSQPVYPNNAVTPEEANILHLFKAFCPGGLAAKVMAEVCDALAGDNVINQKIKRTYFTADELSRVQGDLSQLDITLLYKLVRFACGLALPNDPVWITQGDTLEYYLATVKNMRNELAHKITRITDKELESKIHYLEFLLENILLKTGSLSNRNFQDNIKVMKDEIQPLARPPAIIIDKESYINNIKLLQETLVNQIMEDAEKELHDQYNRAACKNMSPITWCYIDQHKNMTVDKLFTDLEIVDAIDVKIGSTFSLTDKVFPVLLQQNEKMGSGVVIVQGVAGAGKTSLCKFLIHRWSTEKSDASLKAVDLLIYIQCRYVNTASVSSYLKIILPNTFKHIDKDDIIPLMQGSQVLFLVDGYDDARTEAKDLLEDILISLPESKTIITSRPQWVPNLKSKVNQIASCCMVLSLVGFTNDKRDEFIQKLFCVTLGTHQQQKCNQFLAYLNELGEQLEALTQVPLTLTLLAMLWIDDSKNAMEAKTITQLYRKLTDFMLKRLGSQLNISDQDKCRDWMLALGEIAWANLKKNQHYLSDRDLTKLKRKGRSLGVDAKEAISSLLHCDTELSLTDYSEVWSFTHNCQQEFIAAEFLAESVIIDDESLKNILGFHGGDGEEKELQRLIQVIEFIAGLLSMENELTKERASEIFQIALVQAPWSFAAVRRISNDILKSNVEVQEVLKNMFAGQEIADFLDEYDPQSVKWVLESTSLSIPSRIRLRNSVTDVLKMEPLLNLLIRESCHAEIIIAIDYARSTSKAIEFVKNLDKPSVAVILLTWNSYTLNELVKNWPWSLSLHLSFPFEVFPLLWWELVICLVKLNLTGVTLVYNDSNPDTAKLVEEGAHTLNITCKTDASLDAGDIIIISS